MSAPWARMVTIGDATLYEGDAMDVLPWLPNSHLAVSDVPYALTTGGKSESSKTMSGRPHRPRWLSLPAMVVVAEQ